ncbi:methyltransferase domain-containing protein [Acidianus sulfidivorans JP7]|uniref:Class I SAM-dependent methyltransferase n=1 Tax=Acidianus sulfidivorans JP7 TaxID=619593 RepID=A0A2U9IM23_9CREN|nr:class I SAM-dependent methyltransferase [Acidianus sulfidivorans]AWR97067.1 methyltransferase domain-containing protein [Acidianus sulfidivorans JP7]
MINIFQCPIDGTKINENLECEKGHKFVYNNGIYDFIMKNVKSEDILETVAPLYENLWAPLGFFITSFHSYSKLYEDAAQFLSSKVFLDIGTGPGKIFDYIKCENCIGLDISMKFLTLLKNKRGNKAIAVRADATSLPFINSSIDSVSSFLTLHMLSNPSLGIKEISRVLKKDGKCEILVLVKSNYISKFLGKWWKLELKHKDYYISALQENELNIIENKDLGPWSLFKCKKI